MKGVSSGIRRASVLLLSSTIMTCVMLLAISYNFTLTTCSDQKFIASAGNDNIRKISRGDQDRLITGPFRAQKGQDRYVYSTFFKDMDGPGIFVEFGGRDGIMDSNTYFFEKALGWKGLLVIYHVSL